MLLNTKTLSTATKQLRYLFVPKYKQPAPSKIFLNSVRVQFSDQVNYLGLLLNASLKDDNDIQWQVKSLYSAANKIGGTFAQCSTGVKNTPFCAFCMPTVEQICTD